MTVKVGDEMYRYDLDPVNSGVIENIAYVFKKTPYGVWLYYRRPNYLYEEPPSGAWWQFLGSRSGKYKPTQDEAWVSFGVRAKRKSEYSERKAKEAEIMLRVSKMSREEAVAASSGAF